MIVKGSQRGGAKQLGLHLLKTEENEHVEIHEISGFVADDVMGAMKEAHALAQGTKCRQHLFSVSLNPPPNESVRVEVFEEACAKIENQLGLAGHPRMLVFHEKEGRRHAHAVWSRIDADSMTAQNMSFFKTKLRDISKNLYLENGWEMPEGFRDWRLRDPRDCTLNEWQQAKRAGIGPREVKANIRQCWDRSDNGAAFAKALEERGLFLAQGDRRGHVALTIDGHVFAVAASIRVKAKDVRARLGDAAALPSVAKVSETIGKEIAPRISRHIAEAKRIAQNAMQPLQERKQAMKSVHQQERKRLDDKQRERRNVEQQTRSMRLRKGVAGIWDIMTGRHSKTRKQNEMEAWFGVQRDRAQRHDLVAAQLKDRQTLQRDIGQTRERHARQMLGLYRDAARYREMARGIQSERVGENRGRNDRAQPRGPEISR
ncbi:relaxase/mobilization nuclease domain-containing protein [Sphingobium baderi]|uniref:relaxase/mobilization nuclease domain-containing protein n=1 Tax=Sphingobium baderi TaxID=1332080 RepID=UPI002B411ECF|nr:relaxase [Sphingobium baderi]WRD78709.1 relaxase/mobilization nuclease domain-containing protein [Sphingobium baderi]